MTETPPTKRPFQSEFWKLPPEERRKRRAKIVARARRDRANASRLYRESPTASHRDALLRAIDRQTMFCNSHERAGILIPALSGEPPEIFWPSFMKVWRACDRAFLWNRRALRLMRKQSRPASEFMAPEMREAYDALPGMIEVWRGSNRDRVRHFSWTTKREIAKFFAVDGRGAPFPDPVIAHAFIPKEHVFYADNGRNEAEIVVEPRQLREVTIEAAQGGCRIASESNPRVKEA
jgi:hypothetical protein